MKNHKRTIFFMLLIPMIIGAIAFTTNTASDNNDFLIYTVDAKKQDLQLFWKNDKGEIIGNFQNLKTFVESKKSKLIFAMNGGMFKKDFSPQGLFILNKKTITPLDTLNGNGNFYLKPNGVFYLSTNNIAVICKTENFKIDKNIKFATQSGPMLIIDGQIHTVFKVGSSNLNIRNGVGILPDGKIVFAMSKNEINFYDFAKFFQDLGCKNALYLDDFVSKTYLPEKKWSQTDGNFGVIIGVVKNK